ncbi:MAG: efflux RND transporter periplasmic adaptor subunit [Chromatiaceae bacterium]
MPAKFTPTSGSFILCGALLALSYTSSRAATTATQHQEHPEQETRITAEPPSSAPQAGVQENWWHSWQDEIIGFLGGVHPHATDHDQEEHLEPQALTLFSRQTELFVEFPPLVAGENAEFLVHLTRLADFTPLTAGEVRVTLAGGEAPDETFVSPAPARPGLFRVAVTPATVGERHLRIALAAPDLQDIHDLGELPIHPDHLAAEQAAGDGDHQEGGVVLFKEQQWRSDFATAIALPRRLRGSVPATGLLRASADGEAQVTTPIDGHLRPAPEGFPYTGIPVVAGQILAYLVPQLGGDSDVAGLELGVTRATSARNLARQERERLDALWQQKAIPNREVLQARSAEEVAEAELQAASKRLAQVQRTPEGDMAGVPVRAPITGVVAQVQVAPGGFVEEGAPLFHFVNPERLWLEARVAEADIGAIRQPQGAWFRVPGFDRVFEVSADQGGRLVALGALVDPQSRTVPVIFEFPRPDPRLRVGQAVNARVFTGEEEEALAVPVGALVNDAGGEVVYVQTGGERFERRLVRTGLREGDFVAIAEGLTSGERVVSRGAYLVHLAAGTPAVAGHDHAH